MNETGWLQQVLDINSEQMDRWPDWAKAANMVNRAAAYARHAHDSIEQARKYSGKPYWTHAQEVAATVARVLLSTPEMICAAHLHDVIEDVFPSNPLYNRQDIKNVFGQRVLDLVEQLTDEYTKENYPRDNRASRKGWEANRLGACDNEAKTIKLADILSNTADIVANDPVFAVTYLAEKRHLLPFLRGGDNILWHRVADQIQFV